MKSQKLLFLILLLTSSAQLAISKSVIVPVNIFYLDGSASPYNQLAGGDTLFFAAGNRTYLCIKNFKGNTTNPIVMINKGGDVIIDTDHYYGISVQNCRYIKLTGTGDKSMMYGFKIKRVSNGAGLSFCDLSSDFEVDHISIENTLIGGLYAKTDPDGTPSTDRANFTQYNTIIHDNYVAHTADEGMYIGSTKYDGQTVTVNGVATLLYPSILDGVKVYNNIVEYAGWDGIQVSSASKNCQIYNNTVRFDSQAGHDTQMSGIILGGGTKADCFNNYIADGKGVGIEVHGLGGTRVFNNIIVNPGLNYYPGDVTWPKHGMYISDNSVQKDSSFYIFNNTIINPKSDGIRFASAKSKNNLISSNIIINPGNYNLYETDNTSWVGNDAYIMAPNGFGNITLSNNYFKRDALLAGFASTNLHNASDFALTSGSPLIDGADTNPKVSATFDFINNPRPYGLKSDIGAYEFRGATVVYSGGTIGANQSICPGNPTLLLTSLIAPGGFTGTPEYKWQFSTTTETTGFTDISSSNSNSYAPGTLTTTTWFRRLAKIPGMADWTNAVESNVVKITVNAFPAAVAGTDRVINLNSSTQIGVAAVTGSIYSWTSSPAGFSSTLANPTVTPLVNTVYTLTETNSITGCANLHNVTVTLETQPDAQAGVNRTICQNSSTQIGAAAIPGRTYSWISSPVGFTSTLADPTVTPAITTTYTLTETINSTGATNTHNVVVNVKPLPAASAGSNRSICPTSGTQIGAPQILGNVYTWTSSPAGFTSTSSYPVAYPTTTTTYTLTELNQATGCSNSNQVVVTVNQLPAAGVGKDRAICSGASTELGVAPVSGSTYSWSSTPAGFTSTLANPTVAPLVNTNYNLVETVTATGCSWSHNVSVIVNKLPDAVVGANRTICQNSSTQLGAAAVSGNSYSWTSSPSGFSSTLSNPTITPTENTTYALTETIWATGCSNLNSVMITTNPIPVVAVIEGTKSICLGSKTNLSDATVGGTWSSFTTPVATVNSTGTVAGLNAGLATIQYSVTNSGGCTANAVTTVAVHAPASQPGNFIQSSATAKTGQQNIVYTVPFDSGVTYNWTYSGRGVTINGSTNTISLSFSRRATNGILSVTATNGCGISVPRSINISLLKDGPLPESSIPVNLVIPELKNSLVVYPNPTSGSATFDFQISEDAKATLDIFSATGQLLARLFDENIEAGSTHTVHFNQSLPSGIYPCIMQWKGQRILIKLIIAK